MSAENGLMKKLAIPLWTPTELAEVTGGHWVKDLPLDGLPSCITYSHRDLRPGYLYVTMDSITRSLARGVPPPDQYHDSADKLPKYQALGMAGAIIQRDVPTAPAGFPLLRVTSSVAAIHDLARVARAQFRGRVIAVTGTAGKSTTCQMLRHVLSQQGPTYATHGNLNTRIGVPMCLAQTPRDFRYAIYEVAVSGLLLKGGPITLMARPHVAIITTIGLEQTSSVPTVELTADYKSRIYRGLEPGGAAIMNRDMPLFERVHALAQEFKAPRIVHYGRHPDAHVRALEIELQPEFSRVLASVHGEQLEYEVPVPGEAMVSNSLAVLTAVEAVGANWRQAAADLSGYLTLEGRFRRFTVPISGGSFELIDDSWNAALTSVIASFDVLTAAGFVPNGQRIIVLGAIGMLGNDSPEIHAALAEPFMKAGIDRLLTIGDDLQHMRSKLPDVKLGLHARTAEELVDAVLAEVRPGDVVLVKVSMITSGHSEVVRQLRQSAKRATSITPVNGASLASGDQPASIELQSRLRIDIALLGDLYFGEYYQAQRANRGKVNYLDRRGYDYSVENLKIFLDAAAFSIANLETSLCEFESSPFEGKKSYVHSGHPVRTATALNNAFIGAVTLANNHSFDYGLNGFEMTLKSLDSAGIRRFGAGSNAEEALRPLRLSVRIRDHKRNISIFSAYEYSDSAEKLMDCYASEDKPGMACISTELLEAVAAVKSSDPDEFVIVFPHWGKNYSWRTNSQVDIADWLIAAGADLVVGHGAHVLQEIERRLDRWVIFSLGNSVFNSDGRFDQHEVMPFSFLARLVFAFIDDRIDTSLNLYPILSDNRATQFRPRFVHVVEFEAIRDRLAERTPKPWSDSLITTHLDDFGWHFRLAI